MRRPGTLICVLSLFTVAGACEDESITPAANLLPNQDAGSTDVPSNTGGSGGTDSLPPPPLASAIGGPCARSADCGERVCLSPKSYPEGYCSKVCGGDIISEGESCPSGATCVQLGEAAAFCLDLCASASDCRAGYLCASNGQVQACVPRCKASADCGQGESCNTTSGLCEKAAPQTLGRIGAPCTANAQCASNLCLDPTGMTFVGGYCFDSCTKADLEKPCGNNDGVCIDVSTPMKEAFACLAACSTGTDCRKEYLCSVEAEPSSGAGVCLPRCEHYACDMGETCDSSVGVCVLGTPTTGAAQVSRVDFGTLPTGPELADFAPITVNVPADAVSFSIITQATNKNLEVAITQITDPKGKVVFDFSQPASTDYKVIRNDWLPGGGGAVYPNAPRLPLIPGPYKLLVGSAEKTTTKIDALIKRQTGVIAGGDLPVVLWFTKNKFLDATTAQASATFQQLLRTWTEIYAAVGIKLGPFLYKDVPGPNAEKWALINDLPDLGALFENTNDSSEKALHLFLIDQFTFEGGATVLGISGGIPGPPAYPTLRHGGVAVALSFLNDSTGVLAETMAHEGGHFLGLFHTSERNGSSFDPLLDTPQCTTAADTNKDGIVSGAECEMLGASNLMFWSTSKAVQRTITNDQRFVLLRNPSVQ